jgi:hypothetical protein
MLYVLLKFNQKDPIFFKIKKAKKRPNGQTILFLKNCFKKDRIATLLLAQIRFHYADIYSNQRDFVTILTPLVSENKRRLIVTFSI